MTMSKRSFFSITKLLIMMFFYLAQGFQPAGHGPPVGLFSFAPHQYFHWNTGHLKKFRPFFCSSSQCGPKSWRLKKLPTPVFVGHEQKEVEKFCLSYRAMSKKRLQSPGFKHLCCGKERVSHIKSG